MSKDNETFDDYYKILDAAHGDNGNDELLCRETWNHLVGSNIKPKHQTITKLLLKVDTLLGAASKQFDTIKELEEVIQGYIASNNKYITENKRLKDWAMKKLHGQVHAGSCSFMMSGQSCDCYLSELREIL